MILIEPYGRRTAPIERDLPALATMPSGDSGQPISSKKKMRKNLTMSESGGILSVY